MSIIVQRCFRCLSSPNGCTGKCHDPNATPAPQLHGPGPYVFPTAEQPKGCICPPTSEKTCQRPDCGRKGYKASGSIK
jgi:hypothetical protein